MFEDYKENSFVGKSKQISSPSVSSLCLLCRHSIFLQLCKTLSGKIKKDYFKMCAILMREQGSGCSSVGRLAVSNAKDPQFDSTFGHILLQPRWLSR